MAGPVVVDVEGTLVGHRRPEPVGRRRQHPVEHRAPGTRTRVELPVGLPAHRPQPRIGHRVQGRRRMLLAVVLVRAGLEAPEQVVLHIRRRHPVVVDAHPHPAEVRDHRVVPTRLVLLTEPQRIVAARGFPGADQGRIPHNILSLRLRPSHPDIRRLRLPVLFRTVVLRPGLLDAEPELVPPVVALVCVEQVVVVERRHQVLGVHRAAEELEPVVGDAVRLEIVGHRPAAHPAERPPVDLLVGRQLLAAVPHRHVPHGAAAVVVIRPAESVDVVHLPAHRVGHRQIGQSLVDVVRHVVGGPRRVVQPRVAEEHHPAPQPPRREGQVTGVRHVVGHRGEDDRAVGRAIGVEFAAPADEQAPEVVGRTRRGPGPRGPLHHRARLDVQHRVAHHVGEPGEDVGVGRHPGVGAVEVSGDAVGLTARREAKECGGEGDPEETPWGKPSSFHGY